MSASAPQTAPYADSLRGERLAAAAMWGRMLDHIPTQLGKLISVASFRVGDTGEYCHPNLDRVLSPEVARRVLRESHEQLFVEWVGLFPEEQSDDVNRYLAALPREMARELLRKACENLIPSTASAVARRAFVADLETILTAGDTPTADSPRGCEALQSVA
jgi:hypothetical protein